MLGRRVRVSLTRLCAKVVGVSFIMRTSFTSFVILSAVSSSLAAWVPLSQLQNRANSSFLDCLESAGLDPVVQGESDYATDAAAFNLRYVSPDCSAILHINRRSAQL